MTALTRAALISLAERCEIASAGDRGLDFEIAQAAGWSPAPAYGVFWSTPDGRAVLASAVPRFTASLDAALPIEADGYWEISGPRRYLDIPTSVPNHWRAEFFPWAGGHRVSGWAVTEVRARRACALRALAHVAPA